MRDLIDSVFGFFYEIFFGCRHERLTRPFTLQSHTYKVCLDCGKHSALLSGTYGAVDRPGDPAFANHRRRRNQDPAAAGPWTATRSQV